MELSDSTLHMDDGETPERVLPMVLFGALRGNAALLPASWPANDRAQPLRGRRFAGHVELVRDEVPTYNVVGIVRGSDSAFARSYVAFGAHLDHIGVQHPEHGDSIANGADDDGSGTTALLAIAKLATTATHRPRRSFLFVWHTAEELGLYGSEWFTSHPTVPRDSIVAQLNADMIGRNDPDSLYLIGPRSAPNGQSTVLGAIVDSVNAASPHPFLINREWDSPTHPEQLYTRSDHYNYAKHGIPIVFFTTGLHADYHRVTDEPSKIDYDKLARVTELLYHIGVAVANRTTRPLPGR
jgi:Zn-dependent M28 family amino/carboxypeptidase